MIMLVLQTLLLLAIAYILGCLLGMILHQLFGVAPRVAETAAPTAQPVARTANLQPEREAPPAPPPAPVITVRDEEPRVVEPAPKPEPKPAPKDELKRIRGIGPQNEARLNAIGVTRFEHIAGWNKKDQRDIGERLAFPGRIEREQWVKQAKVLAKGGQTEFSKRVDKGEVESSIGKVKKTELGKRPPVLSEPKDGMVDNLTLIDGVGTAIEKKLFALGIYHFDQIAKWTSQQEVWIGNELGFPGRPERENWVKEAKIFVKGGMTKHARRVEAGEISSSRKSKPDES